MGIPHTINLCKSEFNSIMLISLTNKTNLNTHNKIKSMFITLKIHAFLNLPFTSVHVTSIRYIRSATFIVRCAFCVGAFIKFSMFCALFMSRLFVSAAGLLEFTVHGAHLFHYRTHNNGFIPRLLCIYICMESGKHQRAPSVQGAIRVYK